MHVKMIRILDVTIVYNFLASALFFFRFQPYSYKIVLAKNNAYIRGWELLLQDSFISHTNVYIGCFLLFFRFTNNELPIDHKSHPRTFCRNVHVC